MTPNEEYQKIFSDRSEDDRLSGERHELRTAANAEWTARIEAEQKRLQPRRKKRDWPSDDFTAPLRAELLTKYSRLTEIETELKAIETAREAKLCELAPLVIFQAQTETIKLAECSTSAYRSQGFGANKYAKGSLQPMEAKLNSLGFTAEIRYETRWKNENAKYSCDAEGGDFQLWANCSEWMYNAAERNTTLAEALETMRRNSCNARVFMPMLPHSIEI